MKIGKISILLVFLNIFLLNCGGPKVDPVTGKAEKFEPNADVIAKEYAEKNPITLFGGKNEKNRNLRKCLNR